MRSLYLESHPFISGRQADGDDADLEDDTGGLDPEEELLDDPDDADSDDEQEDEGSEDDEDEDDVEYDDE